MNQLIIEILVRRIRNGEPNPATGEPMKLEDIKLPEYKEEVELILNELK